MRTIPILLAWLLLGASSRAQEPSRPAASDTLRPDSAHARQLPAVMVTGARLAPSADRRLPVRATPLDVSGLTGATPAVELLQRIPGVALSNDQGSHAQPTFEVRGFSLSPVVGVPQGVSVFLDGVRVNEPDAQEVNFDLLPIEAVVAAEFSPGPSAMFGKNSLAGALNLRTARGKDAPELTASTTVGSFGARIAHVMASGRRRDVDGLVLLKGSRDDGYQIQSGARTRQLFATVGRASGDDDVALSLLYANDRIFQAGSLPESWLPVARRANYTGGDFFHPELLHLSTRVTSGVGAGRLRGNLFARRNVIEQLNINAGDPNTHAFVRNVSAGATLELARRVVVGRVPVDFVIGGEAARSRVRYLVLAEENADAPGLPDECDPLGDAAVCEDAEADGDDAGLYAQAIVQPTNRLSVLASARGDLARVPFRDRRDPANDGTSVFRHVSPKVGVTYVGNGGFRAFASAGGAFRAPAALELACASPEASCPLPFSLGADPPLAPVVAWSYDAGMDWSPPDGRVLALSFFRTDVRDEIVFVSAERAAGYFQNIARTRRQGAELSFATMFAAAAGRLFGSYTFVDATYRTEVALASQLADNVVKPGGRFALSPRHRATLGIRVSRSARGAELDGTLSARGTSSSFLRGDEANVMSPLPGHVVSDLRVAARWRRAAASIAVSNLFDRRYALFGVYAENPKGAYGGPPSATADVERFLTPAWPRSVSLAVSLER